MSWCFFLTAVGWAQWGFFVDIFCNVKSPTIFFEVSLGVIEVMYNIVIQDDRTII